MNKQWFTVKEIAEYFNVSESLVRKLIQHNKLKYHKVGKRILIRADEFEESVVKTFESTPDDQFVNKL